MGNVETQVAMSELEKIESNRRTDIAYAVVLGAARLFNQLTDLKGKLKSGTKAASSYWYGILLWGNRFASLFIREQFGNKSGNLDSDNSVSLLLPEAA